MGPMTNQNISFQPFKNQGGDDDGGNKYRLSLNPNPPRGLGLRGPQGGGRPGNPSPPMNGLATPPSLDPFTKFIKKPAVVEPVEIFNPKPQEVEQRREPSPPPVDPKVLLAKQVEQLLSDFFKESENDQAEAEFLKQIKSVKIPFAELLLHLIRSSIGQSEREREMANKLICKLKQPDEGLAIPQAQFLASIKTLFTKISELEVESPRAKSFVAGTVATLITTQNVSLKEVGDLLEGGQHYPLFPLILQHLHKSQGQEWLFQAFTESKINLIGMLPEVDRNKQRMADLLEDRNLTFLLPMLRIESDITKQIVSDDVSPANLFKWLKENVPPPLQQSTEFIQVVFGTLLKNIIRKVSEKHNEPETQNFTLAMFADQEREFAKYGKVLHFFVDGHPHLQLAILYSLQTYAHGVHFPKGLIEKWFNFLYELELVEEDIFFKWKEDINDEYPGKGKALFQVNKWLTWLEEEEEEEEEDDDEDDEEQAEKPVSAQAEA